MVKGGREVKPAKKYGESVDRCGWLRDGSAAWHRADRGMWRNVAVITLICGSCLLVSFIRRRCLAERPLGMLAMSAPSIAAPSTLYKHSFRFFRRDPTAFFQGGRLHSGGVDRSGMVAVRSRDFRRGMYGAWNEPFPKMNETGVRGWQDPMSPPPGIFPRDYKELRLQCKNAIVAALEDGKPLLEVEFPSVDLKSYAGELDFETEMGLSMYHFRQIMDRFANKTTRVFFLDQETEDGMTTPGQGPALFADPKFTIDHLMEPPGVYYKPPRTFVTRCDPADSLYVVAHTTFNEQVTSKVLELYEEVTKANGVPILIFNGEMDQVRFNQDYDRLKQDLLPLMSTAYYVRNFKGKWPGVLFRCYPESWRVLRYDPQDSNAPPVFVQEFDDMPTLKEVTLLLEKAGKNLG